VRTSIIDIYCAQRRKKGTIIIIMIMEHMSDNTGAKKTFIPLGR